MQPVQLFDLASQQAKWLSVRQATIAGNVANANTPGYTAMDVEPFEKVLAKTTPSMISNDASNLGGDEFGSSIGMREEELQVHVSPSGNSVVLEEEMIKAGDVRRAFELNTAIVKAFHRMILMTTRS